MMWRKEAWKEAYKQLLYNVGPEYAKYITLADNGHSLILGGSGSLGHFKTYVYLSLAQIYSGEPIEEMELFGEVMKHLHYLELNAEPLSLNYLDIDL